MLTSSEVRYGTFDQEKSVHMRCGEKEKSEVYGSGVGALKKRECGER